ncbi:MAG: 23S rRNA (uracil(1939)-C(5))-methyltransferase RlmD [Atopococcus tabaci]|uniref:23S rRNA (Uracil(1939)-C(5))-methyltransferase RlmD n=1 Tax=Atopococcus tabaci TaxID=269774 RepID=A0AA43UC42_9LACT|nr:23S rRNA (uracil(1939)-C(5))-methyltransferase RlmD [Atopococcus tabaci]
MAKRKPKYAVDKNKSYEAEVIDLTYEGMGVVKIDNYPLFIEGALTGENIRFKVIKTNKNFGYGRLEEILTESPDRVEIENKIYSNTGTMPLQHMTYEAQLKFKQDQVSNNLQRTAKIIDIPVYETLGMDEPYGYRNKAQIPVQMVDGALETGTYRQRSHDLIPLEDFKIQDPEIDRAIVIVRNILRKYQIEAYDEVALTGLIRHLIIRRGYYTGELMVVLVTNGSHLPHQEEIVDEIIEALPDTVSVMQNINDKNTNVILGRKSHVLYGEDKYRDRLLDFTFEISHQSFYQVNPIQTEKLYQTVIDYADLTEDDVVVDAYCGIGTISLALSRHAKQVYGIEIVEDAVQNAERNAAINQVDNAKFFVGASEEILPQWAEEGRQVDVLVVDPPRKGLEEDFIEASLIMAPERIVYVSCNPATLARDVKYFTENGYQAVKAQPVDMFPQTLHVESVVLMTKE